MIDEVSNTLQLGYHLDETPAFPNLWNVEDEGYLVVYISQTYQGVFLHMFKLKQNAKFKDSHMAKIQVLKLANNTSEAGKEDSLQVTLTSLHLTKLLSNLTLTLNYFVEFKNKHYEKSLNISFDYIRAFEFNFKGDLSISPIEEYSYEGAKQNIFNFLELNFSLGDKVIDKENIVINPTRFARKPSLKDLNSFGVNLDGACEVSLSKHSHHSKFLNTKIMQSNHKMKFNERSPLNPNSKTSKLDG